MPYFPVLDNDAVAVPLTLFTIGDLSDIRSLTQFRPVYSPRSRIRGDDRPEPTSIDFEGIIYGKDLEEMMAKRDTILAAASRGEQWLKFYRRGVPYERAIRVGRALRRTSSWVDQREMRALQLRLSMEIIAPYWQSTEEVVLLEDLVAGSNFYNLENVGSQPAYPVLMITGPEIEQVAVTVENRALTWVASAGNLGASMLIIDCLRGEVTQNGINVLADVQDNSLFPELAPGDNDVLIQLVGGPGQMTLTYRHAWDL